MRNIDDPIFPCQAEDEEEEYKSVLDKKEETPKPDCVVQFYRSKQEIKGKYGYKDNYVDQNNSNNSGPPEDYYDASFGFDRYNENVCAEHDIINYEKINHLVPEKPVVKDIQLYLCPYLSLLPGKTISIYACAEKVEGKNNSRENVEIEFKCNATSGLSINKSRDTLEIDNWDNYCKIEVCCKKDETFDDTVIEAYQIKKDGNGGETKVLAGKLIVVGNKVQYKTVIRPVIVRLTNNGRLLNPDTNAMENITDTYNGLISYLNEKSFNQAYIKCEADSDFPQNIHQVEIKMEELTENNKELIVHDGKDTYYLMGKKRDFFNLIAMNYTGKNAAIIKTEAIDKTKVLEKMTKLVQELRKGYKFNYSIHKSGDDCLKAQLFTKAFHRRTFIFRRRPVIDAHRKYREARQEYLEILKRKGISHGYHPDLMDEKYKNGYVHVFFFPDIARADSETGTSNDIEKVRGGTYVPAIASTGGGTAYIMNVCFDPVSGGYTNQEEAFKFKNAFIAHEIGHALGLEHTFNDDKRDYQTPEGIVYYEKKKRKENLENLLLNYERYKNGEIDENGIVSATNESDNLFKIYNDIKAYLNIADKIKGNCIFDHIYKEDLKSNKKLFENLDDFKNGWEPVVTPGYFDRKIKSKNMYWSPNLNAPDNKIRNWQQEIDNIFQQNVLFKYFELALYIEMKNSSTLQTKRITAIETKDKIKSEEEIKDAICRLEQEIEEMEKEMHLLFEKVNLKKGIGSSETEENFMDYTFKDNDTVNEQTNNNNFIHKSFRHFQWKKMWETSMDKYIHKQ